MRSENHNSAMLDMYIMEPGILMSDVEKACIRAKDLQLSSVCIPPLFARKTASIMQGSGVAVAACIGFPFGFQATEAKLAEILLAIVDGIDAVEVLVNYTAIKNADWNYVANEISHILPVVRNAGKKLHIVLETAKLSQGEMIKCCELYGTAEVDMISASSGYSGSMPGTATLELLRSILPSSIPLKTFHSNLTLATLEKLKNLGVNRVGVNFGEEILNQSESQPSVYRK